jgi:hypothetical protein
MDEEKRMVAIETETFASGSYSSAGGSLPSLFA